MNFKLLVWRQKTKSAPGKMVEYEARDIAPEASFLEMLDVVNEDLVQKGEEPIAFEHDCREGICGSCGMMINGKAHGGFHVATCQVYMRQFPDGTTLYVAVSGSPIIGPPKLDAQGAPIFPKTEDGDRAEDGIAVIDLKSKKLVKKLPTGTDPEEFAVSPDGKRIYVSNEDAATASLINVESGKGDQKTYVVRAEGYRDSSIVVDLTTAKRDFSVTLEKIPTVAETPVQKPGRPPIKKIGKVVKKPEVKPDPEPQKPDPVVEPKKPPGGGKIDPTDLADPFKRKR